MIKIGKGSMLRVLLAVLAVSMFSGTAFALDTQSIALGMDNTEVGLGDFVVTVQYGQTVDDGVYGTAGLGVRVHYDSSKITFGSANVLFNEGNKLFADVASIDDLDDFDSDSSTDKYVDIYYNDKTNVEWPYPNDDANYPIVEPNLLDLVEITFNAAEAGTTDLNVTGYAYDSRFYEFSGTGISDISIVAEVKYTVTAGALPAEGGSITPAGATEYGKNESPKYTITVASGYRVKTFTVDTDPDAALTTVTENEEYSYTFDPLQANAAIGVEFEAIPTYTVSATPGENGSISPSGDMTYEEGAMPTYTVTVNDHYGVDTFTVSSDAGATLTPGIDANTFTYTFASGIDSNVAITVTFALNTYTVTPTVGAGGSIEPAGATTSGALSSPSFKIIPIAGKEIDTFMVNDVDAKDALTDNGDGTSTYTFVSLISDSTINVTFKDAMYTVTPTAGAGGTIDPATATDSAAGEDVIITVTPDDCYEVDTFTVGGQAMTLTDNAYTISGIAADTAVDVTFKKMQYTVTPSAGDNGTITPAAAADYDCGSDVAITVAPAAGYVVDTFMVGGQEVTLTANAYTIPAIMADTGVAVTFKLDNQVPVAPTEPIAATIYLGDDKIMGTLTATDPDGDDIASYAVAAQGTMGQVIVVGDAFTYYLTATTVGADTFTFTATDSKGGVSEPIEVTVNVEEQNDAPVCVDQAQVVAAGGVLKGNLVATDTEDTIASYALVTNVAEGDLIVKADGSFTYIAADDAIGQVTFTFMATDSRGKASDVDGVVTITFGDTFTVTASVNMADRGSIDPSGEQTVAQGTDVTFAVTINEGFEAVLTDNGVAKMLDADNTYTLMGVAEDHDIVVTFSEMGEYHSADCGAGHPEDAMDYEISLSELLRVIQLYTQSQGAYHCDATTEDGYASGEGDQTCDAHDSDYNTQNWKIELTELLRVIQFYTLGGYHLSPGSEDDFAAGKE